MNSQENTDAPRHTNRLIHETSPYLLQHAHNPVEWYPWGDEAIERARQENKPILLSIGYSACHWCHVMEHESFESEATARLMNEHFINIKVDREERPDVDQIYMNAVQMMTGHGGWPLTVFLTPELAPFYGGTYFPPEPRHHMPGFPQLLLGVAEAYRTRPGEIAQSATSLLAELRRVSDVTGGYLTDELSTATLDKAFQGLRQAYDGEHGGFGNAPKFPAAMNLEFALRTYHRTGQPEALQMVAHTCHRMAEGGMYDQLGGGFHRYSTDAVWLVPHFEKMLYDNALLARLYLHAYQATNEDFYRRIAVETLDYVVREMMDEQGGFYSTQDADSEGVEGKFFVWSVDEIRELLGAQDARLFCLYYDASEAGNFEEANILHIRRTPEQVAEEAQVSVERLMQAVERTRKILFEHREGRIKPGRDEKIITAWNGLMLASFAEAAAILDRSDYRMVAERNADFILANLRQGDRLLHTYKDGQAKFSAYLDDYSYYASGLVTLYEATGTLHWLEQAVRLTERMIEDFWDTEDGGFFYTGAQSQEQLIVRTKDYFDNATPSGNSVAADLLLRLAVLTGNQNYQNKAVMLLRLVQGSMLRYPSAFGCALGAFDFELSTSTEVAIIGTPEDAGTRALVSEVWRRYLPNKVLAQSIANDHHAADQVPLLRERSQVNGGATAYVCEHFTCQQPVTTASDLAAQLRSRTLPEMDRRHRKSTVKT